METRPRAGAASTAMATMSTSFIGDPFAVLGLPQTASRDDVRRAFRHRARETHPDHRPDDPRAAQRFARLHAAYREALDRVGQAETGAGAGDHAGPNAYAHGWGAPHERGGARGAGDEGGTQTKHPRTITEYEMTVRVQNSHDAETLRRIFLRHGHRPVIGAALARNPAFPTNELVALRRSTEAHWTVDAAIASRGDVPADMLVSIARLAREPVVGMAIAANEQSTPETLDTLVQGPVRLDAALENALAAHPDLSVAAAARLAGRHATNAPTVVRLVERGDLPAELLQRLASQGSRPTIAAAARGDLLRRGLSVPPMRGPQRSTKTLTGYWR